MKFQVFLDGKVATDFDLTGAYVFGPDRNPLRASSLLQFKDGFIECQSDTLDSAGLSVMWPIKGFGRIMLPTTRVRDRESSYNLNLELARARLMQITIKREDWAFFEESNSLADLSRETQELFVKALENVAEPQKCADYADKCLEKSMVFSEKFAQKYAETFLARRHKNNSFGRHTIGCRMQPEKIDDPAYQKRLFDMFGFVTVPVNWAKIEKKQGEFDFSEIDKCLSLLKRRKVFVSAGPLLRFSEDCIPGWLLESKPAFEKIQEYAYNFISEIVKRYAKQIHAWRIISGMNVYNCFGFNFEQSLDITRTAAIASRTADSKSKKVIEIVYPWGEYYANNQQTVPPLVYVDMVMQSGINFDAFGVEMDFGEPVPGMQVRDMMQISARLDCFAPVPKQVYITSVSAPAESDSPQAGCWKDSWSADVQAQWIEMFFKIALGKPFINTITYAGLCDSDKIPVHNSGLLDSNLEPRKAFKTVGKFQKFLLKK